MRSSVFSRLKISKFFINYTIFQAKRQSGLYKKHNAMSWLNCNNAKREQNHKSPALLLSYLS
jgi:hypothetical protein